MILERNEYVDLKGRRWKLSELDEAERRLIAKLEKRARTHPDWDDFDFFWMQSLSAFYDQRGLSRKAALKTAPYQIAQDLSARLAIALGHVREPDYRDSLRQIIRERFPSQRAFCKATGLSEDMLSHVLCGRKHLAIDTLAKALERIGYTIRVTPLKFAKNKPA